MYIYILSLPLRLSRTNICKYINIEHVTIIMQVKFAWDLTVCVSCGID